MLGPVKFKSSHADTVAQHSLSSPTSKERMHGGQGDAQVSKATAVLQNSPIAKRWEGLFAYLVLGYAAAFMTQGSTAVNSALLGARIGFVIYAVSITQAKI